MPDTFEIYGRRNRIISATKQIRTHVQRRIKTEIDRCIYVIVESGSTSACIHTRKLAYVCTQYVNVHNISCRVDVYMCVCKNIRERHTARAESIMAKGTHTHTRIMYTVCRANGIVAARLHDDRPTALRPKNYCERKRKTYDRFTAHAVPLWYTNKNIRAAKKGRKTVSRTNKTYGNETRGAVVSAHAVSSCTRMEM